MKLEFKSRNVLAETKSRAKQLEFEVRNDLHLEFSNSPKKLLVLTLAILGELAAIESRESLSNNGEIVNDSIESLKSQLIMVSQYFDALQQSQIDSELESYLRIVGAASYYLADMPGSSSVLIKPVLHEELTPTRLENNLVAILKGDYADVELSLSLAANKINFLYSSFLNADATFDEVMESCAEARLFFYGSGSDRELLFIDVLIALVKRKLQNSSIRCLPIYTDLDLSFWMTSLKRPTFITEFWPAQKILGEQGVFKGASAVIQMPTSAGKTKSTEIVIRSAFLSGRTNLAVVVAPFRALCREISGTFETVFKGENVSINELLDIPQMRDEDADFLQFILGDKFRDPRSRKTIVVATPEKLVYLLRQKPELAERIGLLILDEGHQFDNGARGVTYELMVTSLRQAVPADAQILLISAVIANAKSIGDWLYGDRGIEINGSHCIPTLRSIAFASWSDEKGQLNYLDPDLVRERDYIVPEIIEKINLGRRKAETVDRFFPDRIKTPPSVPAYLGARLSQLGAVAIFCGSKVSVNAICNSLVQSLDRGLNIYQPISKADLEEIKKLHYLAVKHFGAEEIVSRSIEFGILPHSAGIPNGVRVSIEWAMANGKAKLVVCTSTLSQGVNLPIKYLVVSSTSQAGEEITTRDFHNLMGRVGRAGYHTEGSVIFSNLSLFENRQNYTGKKKWNEAIALLNADNTEVCQSSLREIIAPTKFLGFPWNLLEFIENPVEYEKRCLAHAENLNIDASSLMGEMRELNVIIQKIESYMLSYSKDNPEIINYEDFGVLATRTLAYHLSTPDERQLLVSIFQVIARRVLGIDKLRIAYFGRALLGLSQLESIESWLREHHFEIMLCISAEDFLEFCWPMIMNLSNHQSVAKLQPPGIHLLIAKAWIKGLTYEEIFSIFKSNKAFSQAPTRKMPIKMLNVVDFLDGMLAYDAMLIVGAIADVAEGIFNDPDLGEKLRGLQSSLKLGLPSEFEKWLYGRGYVDREVCKAISSRFSISGLNIFDFEIGILSNNKILLDEILAPFPTYFKIE